ncbi:MAG: NAD(P)H-dependent oxidoreductase [Burkholderiales bacterium]|nr:NAD(P)H-dependent oxidoreductase [Burkholderiales bacterium]
MRVLMVYCHPVEGSFNAAVRDRALAVLRSAGHEVELVDLYREGFDPVLSTAEREAYLADTAWVVARVQRHVDLLMRTEGLVFVYPTWWYGPPAMLKGWLERTWLPDVAFTVPKKKGERAGPGLRHIRWLCCITTSGSPWWWLQLIRDPGRMLFVRGVRALMARRCKVTWLQLFSMNNVDEGDLKRFLERVGRTLGAVR